MNYSPEALEAFVQTAELGSFSAAARRLQKRQSTISEAVARLEIDLGITLFDRNTRQPTLTEAGEVLLKRAHEVLAAEERLSRTAAQLVQGQESRLTLALSDTYHSPHYEHVLAELATRYPELNFECLIAEAADTLDLIHRGRVDLGVLASQHHYPPDIAHYKTPDRVRFELYVARDHPLAELDRVTPPELAQWRALRLETLVDTSTEPDPLPETFGRHWSAANYFLLLEMAISGFGWAELPHWMVDGYSNNRLKALPMSAGWPRTMPTDVVWSASRGLGSAGNWLLQRLSGTVIENSANRR